jgi:hypothetical protein
MMRRSTDGVEQVAEHGHAQGGEQEAQPVVEPHGADEGQRHEGAQHHQVALGEIDHLGGFVDQHEAERDQAVDAALRSAADDELEKLHLAVPHIRGLAASPSAPTRNALDWRRGKR